MKVAMKMSSDLPVAIRHLKRIENRKLDGSIGCRLLVIDCLNQDLQDWRILVELGLTHLLLKSP